MSVTSWNDASICQPSIVTYKYEGNFDTDTVRAVLEDALDTLANQQALRQEAAILSRLHYKMGTKFRHDIGYSYLKRTRVALLKYANFDLSKTLRTLLDVVEADAGVRLPARQMLEFVLVRLQAFHALMRRIVECSETSGAYFFDRIKRNDAWWLSFMPFAVLSRIRYAAGRLLDMADRKYRGLLPFRSRLRPVGVPFLDEAYIFPNDLKSNDNSSDLVDPAEKQIASDFFVAHARFSKKNIEERNLGESVSREEYTRILEESNQKSADVGGVADTPQLTQSKKVHHIQNVRNIGEFKKFFKLEKRYRETGDERAATEHLSLMQWQSVEIVIKKLISKADKENEINIMKKLKKTWMERCNNNS